MKRRWLLKTISYFAVIFFSVLLAAYVLFPFYLPVAISHFLKDSELRLLSVKVGYPTWKRLNIRKLVLARQSIGQLLLEGGRLSYEGSKGLSLYVNSVHLAYDEVKNTTRSQPPTTLVRSEYLPSVLLKRAPQLSVYVERLTHDVPGDISAQIKFADLEFSNIMLTADANSVRGQAQMSVQTQNVVLSHRFDLLIDNKNHLTFYGTKDNEEQRWLDISADMTKEQSMLVGEINSYIMLSKVSEFLPQPSMFGDVRVKNQLTLPETGAGMEGLQLAIFVDANVQQQHGLSARLDTQGQVKIKDNKAYLSLFDDAEFNNSLSYKIDNLPEFDVRVNDGLNIEMDLNSQAIKVETPLQTHVFFMRAVNNTMEHLASITQKNINIDLAAKELGFNVRTTLKSKGLSALLAELDKKNEDGIFSDKQQDIVLDGFIKTNQQSTAIAFTEDQTLELAIRSLENNNISQFTLAFPPQDFIVNHGNNTAGFFDKTINADITLSYDKPAISLENHLILRSSGQNIHAELISEPLVVDDYQLPAYIFNLNLDLAEEGLTKADFWLNNMCQQRLVEGDWQSREGASQLRLEADAFFSKQSTSKHWLNIDRLPLDVTKGELSAKLHIDTVGEKTTIAAEAKLLNGNILGEFGSFEGVQLRFSTPSSDSVDNRQEFSFETTVATANVGVDMHDIKATGVLNIQTQDDNKDDYIVLNQASAKLFSGTISLQPGRIDFGDNMDVRVNITDVDLSEVVRTQQIDGLQTTGKVSGSLPVSISAGSAVIDDGKLHNNNGGLIRYSSPLNSSTDLNEQLKLTLDVLENFNYEILNTQVNFNKGRLIFKSQISGNNPDVAGGQRVDLNLNTEVDMSSTMELLRLQSGLEAEIEQLLNNNLGGLSNTNICEQRL